MNILRLRIDDKPVQPYLHEEHGFCQLAELYFLLFIFFTNHFGLTPNVAQIAVKDSGRDMGQQPFLIKHAIKLKQLALITDSRMERPEHKLNGFGMSTALSLTLPDHLLIHHDAHVHFVPGRPFGLLENWENVVRLEQKKQLVSYRLNQLYFFQKQHQMPVLSATALLQGFERELEIFKTNHQIRIDTR